MDDDCLGYLGVCSFIVGIIGLVLVCKCFWVWLHVDFLWEISPPVHLEMRFHTERLQQWLFPFFILFFFTFFWTDMVAFDMEFDSDTDVVLSQLAVPDIIEGLGGSCEGDSDDGEAMGLKLFLDLGYGSSCTSSSSTCNPVSGQQSGDEVSVTGVVEGRQPGFQLLGGDSEEDFDLPASQPSRYTASARGSRVTDGSSGLSGLLPTCRLK